METITAGPVQALVVAALVLIGTYLYRKLYHMRFVALAHLPQHPSSLCWGHLRVFDEFMKRGIADRHPDIIFSEMNRALGDPPLMMVDNWPVFPTLAIIRSHGIAEQNEEWKAVRRRFNPGFSPKHLMTLLPVLVDKAAPFVDTLDNYAQTGEAFSLDEIATNLTFDVIGAVTMGEDMEAQHLDPARQGELVRNFRALLKTPPPGWMTPFVHAKRRALGERNSQLLGDIVRRNFQAKQRSASGGQQQQAHNLSRSVLALSLQEVETLTPEIIEETCDQLKTFLFAGHDTTSTTIMWALYELSRTPHALQRVRAELDGLFGSDDDENEDGGASDPAVVRRKLLEAGGEDIVRRLTYVGAVIKEVLRLYPPAGSVRAVAPGTGFVVSTSQGDEYNLDGTWVYLNHYLIQRDRAVYGETADEFVPERWLQKEEDERRPSPDGGGGGSDGDGGGSGSIPVSAWRAFERGPRNCIGQELANIEARVILAFVARRYDFTKVGLGALELDSNDRPVLDEKGRYYKVKSELYSTIRITGKPVDGMMIKVGLSSAAGFQEYCVTS
ncbi:cytochrome P450 [Apiospora rasikravindrae]|uniref:Cytochrome P450 n=1 Tax=Apiospora rasikravindrae TaxID=990691 RepID=A0ABR1TFQ4_9PEZI